MLSYWEKQSFLHYDCIIIGGGITGLSAAISLKEKRPGISILVMERGILPTGASTKNAGFACIGSFSEILEDLKTLSPGEVISLVQMRRNGLKKLRERLGDKNIDYRENGSYELIGENQLSQLNQLDQLNRLLYPILGGDAFSPASEKISSFGFNTSFTRALVQNHFEGELHTGKMMRSLIDLALKKGIEIKTGCEANLFEEENNAVSVTVRHTFLQEEVVFRANTLIICTNAFTRKLLPEADLQPGRGQVLITEPIAGLPFRGIFHFDKGYYYFREIDGRVLFGGGRNLDFETEATAEFDYNARVLEDLEEKLGNIILPGIPYRIAGRWMGIMAFGKTKQPIIKRHSERVLLGVRLGGMGVAIGSEAGERLAEMALE